MGNSRSVGFMACTLLVFIVHKQVLQSKQSNEENKTIPFEVKDKVNMTQKEAEGREKEFAWGNLGQDSSLVVDHLKTLLEPPSTSTYNFTGIQDKAPRRLLLGQYGQLGKVADLFQGKRDGFFIESGALDGEKLSNSLLFELELGWEGLLVEANPEAFITLRTKHRKCHSINVGLSTAAHPMEAQFEVMEWDAISGVIEGDGKSARQKGITFKDAPVKRVVTVQCFPLYSILAAMGNPTVDYLSLDVEGAELGILENIPWGKVDIRVIQVEFTHIDQTKLAALMDKAGYENPFDLNEDMIFVKRAA